MPTRWRLQTNRIGPIEVDIFWRPAHGERSGDFYDLIDKREGKVVVVLGDAPGHGPDAASLGEGLRSRFRASIVDGASITGAMTDLDDHVSAQRRPDLLASCVAVELDPASNHFDIVNAGHPPPMILGAASTATFIDGPPDPLLGISSNRHNCSHYLAPDSVLCLYTDGLIERPGGPLITDGLELLAASARELPHVAAAAALARAVTHAVGEPSDDATILTIRVNPRAIGHSRQPSRSASSQSVARGI